MKELMRLVETSQPLGALDASTLGPRGKLTLANTPKGAAARNSMHNRVVSDAFVPAGGRPSTVNGSNWREFLQADGSASTKLVVEGANLFFTGEARAALYQARERALLSICHFSSTPDLSSPGLGQRLHKPCSSVVSLRFSAVTINLPDVVANLSVARAGVQAADNQGLERQQVRRHLLEPRDCRLDGLWRQRVCGAEARLRPAGGPPPSLHPHPAPPCFPGPLSLLFCPRSV